jgi:hypothetical protein
MTGPDSGPVPGCLPWRDSDGVLIFDPVRLAGHHRVVLDTESLTCAHAFDVLCGQLLPALVECKAQALLSSRSIDALHADMRSSKPAIAQASRRGADIVRRFQESGALIDARDPHVIAGGAFETESLLTELFVGYQLREKLCLVTQNDSLAMAVLRNARSEAFSQAQSVVTAYVSHDGLRNWAPELLESRILPSTGMDVGGREMDLAMCRCKVFVDTCSWMLEDKANDGATTRGAEFLQQFVLPELRKYGNPLMQPERVSLELEHIASGGSVSSRHALAGIDSLAQFEASGLAVLASDPDEVADKQRFADPVFVRLAVRFQSEFDLCFVTQDTKLAELLLACRKPGTGRLFLVTYIPMRGEQLKPWAGKLQRSALPRTGAQAEADNKLQAAKLQAVNSQAREAGESRNGGGRSPMSAHDSKVRSRDSSGQSRPDEPRPAEIRGFVIHKELTRPDPTPIAITAMPEVGETVIGLQSGALMLVAKIASGGEGTVYQTNRDGVVCKIYHQDCLTRGRQEKLSLMVSRKVRVDGVCWPLELVHNLHKEFVGFLMPKVTGKMLRTSVFAKVLLAKHFPDWTRIELTELAITMLKAIRELHYLGVLVGDVNPQNILVQGPNRIAIVDADSFQVEGYACTVGTETFTPPQLQGKNFAEFLRSHDDELYAVATLLFETLFPGKAPYAAQGGGDVSENIRNMRFAYGRDADGRPPVGPWQFIWSHLHPRLKEDFTSVFARGERVGINDLIKHLEWSVNEMRGGTRDQQLFPEKPWQREGQTVSLRCETCPPEKIIHEVSQYLADKLKAEGKGFVCSACSAMKKMNRLQRTREVDCESRISPMCEGRSQASVVHLETLKREGKPYWCRQCTAAQKERWAAERVGRPQRGPRPTNRVSASSKTPCFVATAVYQDPMALPVVAMRNYRDTVLARHAGGRLFIGFYYFVGPWLARVVEAFPAIRYPLRRLLDCLSAWLASSARPNSNKEAKE